MKLNTWKILNCANRSFHLPGLYRPSRSRRHRIQPNRTGRATGIRQISSAPRYQSSARRFAERGLGMNGFRPEYIRAAIQNEANKVALAAASTRNDTLNRAAFNLASLGVSASDIIHSLRPAALQSGLKNGEIYSTINSGMRAGKQHPRSAPTNGHAWPGSNVTPIRAVEASPMVKVVRMQTLCRAVMLPRSSTSPGMTAQQC